MVLVGTGGLPGDSQESLHKQIIKMRGVFIPATLRTTANICINTRVPRDFGSYLPTLRLQKPRVEFPYQSLELIFFSICMKKMSNGPFFYINYLCTGNNFTDYSILEIELFLFVSFIWTPRQIALLNLKYSLRRSIRRKLVYNRGRREKQRAVPQTVTSVCFEHSNLAPEVKA